MGKNDGMEMSQQQTQFFSIANDIEETTFLKEHGFGFGFGSLSAHNFRVGIDKVQTRRNDVHAARSTPCYLR